MNQFRLLLLLLIVTTLFLQILLSKPVLVLIIMVLLFGEMAIPLLYCTSEASDDHKDAKYYSYKTQPPYMR